MFDLLTMTARDAAMLGGGAIAVAAGLAAVGVVHKVSPAVSTWLAKEKTTILAVEDKMKSGFGFASRAITNVADKAKADAVALHARVDGVNDDVAATIARLEKLEAAVFGKAPQTPTAA